jgi:hypothetical protein
MAGGVEPATLAILLSKLVPIASVLMPVGIVFIVMHFRMRQKELDAELETRRLFSKQDRVELEARIARLEAVLLAASRVAPVASPELYEAPPLADQPVGAPAGRRDPIR